MESHSYSASRVLDIAFVAWNQVNRNVKNTLSCVFLQILYMVNLIILASPNQFTFGVRIVIFNFQIRIFLFQVNGKCCAVFPT